ncbi:hypothetical protein [Desulfosudis oleivorans]|uniref:Lipoprotein n=1 Tax=Desulfosudis oleivorans (strain DSM 6200 / JCM 39069 / Hxd3) TaxID=96561 RepID=A8ZXV4_DESOH|nr:hypothetical protein [Desulfosudis oleivorans]ABW68581.1 hypothetical protein Dole_2778 [Desulfosudis oleivorans Hxd3]
MQKNKHTVFWGSLFLITVVLLSCKQAAYTTEDFLGIWDSSPVFGDSEVSVQISLRAHYKKDGAVVYSGQEVFKVGDRKATVDFEDTSRWRIDGVYLIEETIDKNYFNYNGDIELINILKKNIEKERSQKDKTSKAKILNYQPRQKFDLLLDLGQEEKQITFHFISKS